MFLIRIATWVKVFSQDAWCPILAQDGTTVQKAVDSVIKSGKEFGESNDSVRFGIILFALLALLGYLAYLYISSDRARIKELEARLKAAEEKLDKEREGRREDQEQRNAVMQYSIAEFISAQRTQRADLDAIHGESAAAVDLLRRALSLGDLPMRTLPPAPPASEPPRQPPPGRTNFLPRTRRVPTRASDANEETSL